MLEPNNTLKALQATALHHLDSVDLLTPMRQLDEVLAALIEVPTRERRTDTEFAQQAALSVDILIRHTHRLLDRVHTLTEHVSGSLALKVP